MAGCAIAPIASRAPSHSRSASYFDGRRRSPLPPLPVPQGSKVTHFNAIQKECGVAFEEMLFFDDDPQVRFGYDYGYATPMNRR